MVEYEKINEGIYRNKKHLYLIKQCEYCGSKFFCRKDKINTKKTCNPSCYQNLVEKNNTYIINDHVNEVIIGSLLSDGCINNSNNGKNYFWSHTCIIEDYIDFIINDVKINLHKFSIDGKFFKSPNNGKEYFGKKQYIFKSKASVTFTKFRNDWYPQGKKIVPKFIKLTPIVLLHWYIGDGSISDCRGITLSTDSFDMDSLDFLLYELYNLNFNPYLNNSNRIIIPNSRIIEFLNYIGKCPVKGFEYKWKTSIKESYIGRMCVNCGNVFNAIQNHQKYCNPKCAIDFSKKNNKE